MATRNPNHISYHLDDTGNDAAFTPDSNTQYVMYEAGFEPLVVAVKSYLPDTVVPADEAEELATEYLQEIGWSDNPEVQAIQQHVSSPTPSM